MTANRRRARTSPPEEAPSEGHLPWWVPAAVYAAVTLLLFRAFVFSDEMLLGQDTLAMGYMAREFYQHALVELGTFPLWNPYLYGGVPFVESMAGGDSFYPPSVLLLFLTDLYRSLGWKLVLHVFLAGIFMYGWVRSLGASRPAALTGGLAYLMAPSMVTLVYPGHDGKLFVAALTPLLFWAAERSLRSPRFLPFAALGMVIPLVILTPHIQMAYFLFGGVGVYYIVRILLLWLRDGLPQEAAGRLGVFLAVSVIGAGVAGFQLIPAYDYVADFSRRAADVGPTAAEEGVEWSSSWSLHPEEVMGLVIPEFVGNTAGGAEWAEGTYWGRNPFKINHEYLGITLLVLAGLAFMGGARPDVRWPLVGIGGTALLFAVGTHTPVWRIFYELVPGIDLFRAPSMAIFLTAFSATTLMAFGVDRGLTVVRDGSQEDWRRMTRYLLGACGAVALLALLAVTGALTSLWTTVLYGDLPADGRQVLEAAESFITRGALLAAVLTALVGAAFWGGRQGFLGGGALAAVLCVLLAVDLGRVNDPFIQTVDYHAEVDQTDENLRYLQDVWADDEPFRVFSMFNGGEDVRPAQHGVEVAAGHHPNDIGRYRDLLGMMPGGMPEELLEFNANAYDLLGVRYILWPDFQFGSLEGVEPVSRLATAEGQVHSSVYPSNMGGPRARLVGDVVVEDDDQAAVDLLLDPNAFDPQRQAVVANEPPVELPGTDVDGEVTWLERDLNRQRLEVQADEPSLLVLSENWFPAWQATVDGEEVPLIRTNHTFRGIPLEPGHREVELVYSSSLLRGSALLSLICALILVGGGFGSWWRWRRGAMEGSKENPAPEGHRDGGTGS